MKPVPQPPQPPELPREAKMPLKRVLGVGFLALFPILALAGVLANHETAWERTEGPLQVRIEYPDRLRYFTEQPMDIEVRNTGGAPVEKAEVTIERKYLLGFVDASYVPDPSGVTEDEVSFDLGKIPPGESRRVQIELKAERYGPQVGKVRVEAGQTRTEGEVRTFVFP